MHCNGLIKDRRHIRLGVKLEEVKLEIDSGCIMSSFFYSITHTLTPTHTHSHTQLHRLSGCPVERERLYSLATRTNLKNWDLCTASIGGQYNHIYSPIMIFIGVACFLHSSFCCRSALYYANVTNGTHSE